MDTRDQQQQDPPPDWVSQLGRSLAVLALKRRVQTPPELEESEVDLDKYLAEHLLFNAYMVETAAQTIEKRNSLGYQLTSAFHLHLADLAEETGFPHFSETLADRTRLYDTAWRDERGVGQSVAISGAVSEAIGDWDPHLAMPIYMSGMALCTAALKEWSDLTSLREDAIADGSRSSGGLLSVSWNAIYLWILAIVGVAFLAWGAF